ncbi:MAG: hypothetical protein EXS43_07970 [Opitutus sp.]|nr:hypothetical protein [Opitutus sp.]
MKTPRQFKDFACALAVVVGAFFCDLGSTALIARGAENAKPAGRSAMDPSVSGLSATFRDGQVFLVWKESPLPAGTVLNVYRHFRPITTGTLADAVLIGHHVQPGSARDWWKDPSAFKLGDAPGTSVGFVIGDGLPPLDPSAGLFVHTATADEGDNQYFAITVLDPKGVENREVLLGQSSLSQPVSLRKMPVQAIWVGPGAPPVVPANLPIVVRLAGGAGPNDPNYNYLAFGDTTMGWRESLSFKFKIIYANNCLNLYPSDRVWYNRSLGGPVAHFQTPAGIALHFGYNSKIYDEAAMKDGTIVNYNERRLLWTLDWVHRAFKTDPNRVHVIGSSGGGAGLMLALHHPSVFASVCAMVPCVSYVTSTDPDMAANDAYTKVLRLLGGDYGGGVPYAADLGGFAYLDGVSCVKRNRELPFLVVDHGRKDRPTPWSKTPAFYRALDEHKAGFVAWWDDGEHAAAGKGAPEDVRQKMTVDYLLQFSKGTSFPAFSNCSDNKDPGHGNPAEGDIVGWMNRGFKWKEIVDTERRYAISIQMTHSDVKYPVTANVTLRSRQRFKPGANRAVTVAIDREPTREVFPDENGVVTVPAVVFPSPEYRRIEITYR